MSQPIGVAPLWEVVVDHLDRVMAVAKQLLTERSGSEPVDLWLWEHSERVMRFTKLIAVLPELADSRADRSALAVAGLFHDAGWTGHVHHGNTERGRVLSRPTNDIQRELGAALAEDKVRHLVPSETLRRAVEAIRQCNDRYTELIEAQILAEAENLDEVGTMYLLRQFRQYQAEGRPIEQLMAIWVRQKEYQYWDARINDCFRFETTRQLARERLAAVDQFMSALARDHEATDLRRVIREAGLDPALAGS
ncbi:MAG: HD domain-containing protein [Planctomycetes bacterium]|nr:HD domain-containing protein [Planctomycetota bacterium]